MIAPAITTLMMGIYSLLFLCFFDGVTAKRSYRRIRMAVIIAMIMLTCLFADIKLHILGIILYFPLIVLLYRYLLFTSWGIGFYIGSLFSITLFGSRGIVLGTTAMIRNLTVVQVWSHPSLYPSVLGMAVLASGLIWLPILKRVLDNERLKQMICNAEQLRSTIVIQCVLLVLMVLIYEAILWDPRLAWFTLLFVISYLVCVGISIFVLGHAMRVSGLLEYRTYTLQMQDQLGKQLRHYEAYRKHIESFRAFRHDYNRVMGTLKTLIACHEEKKAIKLLDEIFESIQHNVQLHESYSNNLILDAILKDTANACLNRSIRFSAMLPVPEDIALNDLDTIRVFVNLVNNALEACAKVPKAQRFLEITGEYNPNWIYAQTANSYDGEPLKFDPVRETFCTSKAEKRMHGFGLQIIREIVANYGGIVLMEANPQQKVFTIKIHIPRNAHEKKALAIPDTTL